MRILVAGMGNVLRADDGFGVIVAQGLAGMDPPAGVRVIEVGIGGIHLVQELFDPVDALVVVDTVDAGVSPGTVVVFRPPVLDVTTMLPLERREHLADMHYATPDRAFMLAHAMGTLPASLWVVGCQPLDTESLGTDLTPPVAAAVEHGIHEVRRLVGSLGVAWRSIAEPASPDLDRDG